MLLAVVFAVLDGLGGAYLLAYAVRRRERKRPEAVLAVSALLLVVAVVLGAVAWHVAHRQKHCIDQNGQRVACTTYTGFMSVCALPACDQLRAGRSAGVRAGAVAGWKLTARTSLIYR